MLGDFIKLISDIKDSISSARSVTNGQTKTDIAKFVNRSAEFHSVQRAAEKSILPFPVVISDQVSTESALILAKSVEKNMAQSIVQIAASTESIINASGDAAGAANAFISRFRGIGKLSEAIEAEDWDTINEMSSFLLNHYKLDHLTEEYDLELKQIIMTNENLGPAAGMYGAPVQPGKKGAKQSGPKKNAPSAAPHNLMNSPTAHNGANFDPMGPAGGSYGSPSNPSRYTPGARPSAPEEPEAPSVSVGAEVAKANKFEAKMAGMDPTYIKVTIKLADGAKTSDVTLTLGVKATAHLVNSNQLQDAMMGQLLNDDFITSFVRWTTGEISFFKDLVLNYNTVKNAALKSADNESKQIIANLSRNASKAKMADVVGGKSFIPNTQIILSREDVNNIKINTKQDLMKPQVAKSIIEKLNLASIIVVDEMSDVAHVIHDSELTDGYSVVSIRGEAKDNDSKKVLAKLISNVG